MWVLITNSNISLWRHLCLRISHVKADCHISVYTLICIWCHFGSPFITSNSLILIHSHTQSHYLSQSQRLLYVYYIFICCHIVLSPPPRLWFLTCRNSNRTKTVFVLSASCALSRTSQQFKFCMVKILLIKPTVPHSHTIFNVSRHYNQSFTKASTSVSALYTGSLLLHSVLQSVMAVQVPCSSISGSCLSVWALSYRLSQSFSQLTTLRNHRSGWIQSMLLSQLWCLCHIFAP